MTEATPDPEVEGGGPARGLASIQASVGAKYPPSEEALSTLAQGLPLSPQTPPSSCAYLHSAATCGMSTKLQALS